MYGFILALLALGLSEGSVITGSQRLKFDLYAATKRVSLLGQQLAQECPHLYESDEYVFGKREIVSDAHLSLKLQIEQQLLNHLLDLLIRCRSANDTGSAGNSTAAPFRNVTAEPPRNYTAELSSNITTGPPRNSTTTPADVPQIGRAHV